MKSKIVALILLLCSAFLIYARIPQLIIEPHKELWFVAAESTDKSFSYYKVKYLLWRNSDPLYVLPGNGSTTYSAVINSKNYALITVVSAKVPEQIRKEYYDKYKNNFILNERDSFQKSMLLIP